MTRSLHWAAILLASAVLSMNAVGAPDDPAATPETDVAKTTDAATERRHDHRTQKGIPPAPSRPATATSSDESDDADDDSEGHDHRREHKHQP